MSVLHEPPRTDTESRAATRAGGDCPTRDDGYVRGLLKRLIDERAGDLILVADAPPTIHVNGKWKALDLPAVPAVELDAHLKALLTPHQIERLDEAKDLDFAIELAGAGRCRANIHYQRGTLAAAFRSIPGEVPTFESLNLPEQVLSFADYPNGLVLVTGGTGQGKSTTLATLIDHINHTRAAHVITIEDPVEFAFTNDQCLIEQREIGSDSPTFGSALRHVLRQRPDVIVIGELRDLETISTALTAAETGHLVFGSLHTSSTSQTLARLIDVFPPMQQGQIRVQLAASLRAIVCQTLLRDEMNETLIPATEILVATTGIRRALRENETHLINSMIETGRSLGMHTLEQNLAELVQSGRIDKESALAATTDRARLSRLIGDCADTEELRAGLRAANRKASESIPWAERAD